MRTGSRILGTVVLAFGLSTIAGAGAARAHLLYV
jgi:hypothetical protein